jgi:hypothetical protein
MQAQRQSLSVMEEYLLGWRGHQYGPTRGACVRGIIAAAAEISAGEHHVLERTVVRNKLGGTGQHFTEKIIYERYVEEEHSRRTDVGLESWTQAAG